MVSELDEILSSLRQLEKPEEIARRVAKYGAEELQKSLETTLAAGQDAEGKAWGPKKDGGRAYEHAPSRVTTRAHEDLIVSTLTGPEVFGHFGNAHLPQRKMLPDAGAGMPKSVSGALTRAANRVFREVTGK